MSKYFSYDPTGDGFNIFTTAEEAKASIQEALNLILSDDYEEDEIEFMCWGEIKGKVVMKNKREPTEEEKTAFRWDFVADVVLEDIAVEWANMDSAPRDETPILVDFGIAGVHRVFWEDGIWCVTDNKYDLRPLRGYLDKDVKGWMPLPESRT